MAGTWITSPEAALSGFAVIVERGEDGGYGAWSPDLPGCVAVSDFYDECVRLMREAIPLHIDSLRRHGDPVPLPSTVGVLTIDAA
ncbi:MAG: type II toxin-antitoxin system HicB family antitoxin [Pseudonocardiales bacterium]